MNNEAFGIMDEGYFISRGEIIQWVNQLLQLSIIKIEQFGSGAVYCQILDAMYPEKIQMNKVNFRAKTEYDFIQNFKILQQGFEKMKIKRHIEVEKLIKCRYQDNLEFIQWMKRFYDCNTNSNKEYDPVSRRKDKEPDFSFALKSVQPKTFDPQGNMIVNNPQMSKQEKKTIQVTEKQQNVQVVAVGGEKKEKENLKNEQNIQKKQPQAVSADQVGKKQQNPLKGKINPMNSQNNQDFLKSQLDLANAKIKAISQVVINVNKTDSEKVKMISGILELFQFEQKIKSTQEPTIPLQQQQNNLYQDNEEYDQDNQNDELYQVQDQEEVQQQYVDEDDQDII